MHKVFTGTSDHFSKVEDFVLTAGDTILPSPSLWVLFICIEQSYIFLSFTDLIESKQSAFVL